MKRFFPLVALFVIITIGSCEDLSMYSIMLDNQSNFEVTVELYTGTTNEDGSMFFEDYTVSANSKKNVKSDVNTVYVDTYTPSGDVAMNVDGSRITFTNR
jgi:hypothetical protein